MLTPEEIKSDQKIREWRKDVFMFAEEMLGGIRPSEPLDVLRGKEFEYTDAFGDKKKTILFDKHGRLVHHELKFYKKSMFKHQDKAEFKEYCPNHFTWQQTVELEAYNRAINTFDKDSYDIRKRWITIRSGHGVGKTSFASVISLHFLYCFYYSQIGATANTDMQLKEVFMKEFYKWKKRMPEEVREEIVELDDKIKIKGTKDWFLRARVAGKDNPEALAGIHGEYVMLFIDEASGVGQKMAESMEGALTGDNWIVIMVGNPTRNEGFFFDSHKPNAPYTQLHFDSRESPIVKDGFINGIISKYGGDSEQFSIRVSGEFAGVADMDEKGWIPLFANLTILFEPQGAQVIRGGIIGVDPAGQGRDTSEIVIRDNVYMKELLREATSGDRDLARKIETFRDAYDVQDTDIGVDAFGIGARVVGALQSRTVGSSANALLCDKPREETKTLFASYKAELAWKFRQWVASGGIIITNNKQAWLRELSLIKYKRDLSGRIQIMGKVEFKKEYGFSPDRFDACCYSFFRDEPTVKNVLTKEELEVKEMQEFLQRVNNANRKDDGYSDMSSM